MSEKLLQQLKNLVNEEIQKQLTQFAQIVSKRHDISLKLLIEDLQSFQNGDSVPDEDEAPKCGQCMGITNAKKRCTFGGKYNGYCYRHKTQRKKVPEITEAVEVTQHIGHTLKEKMFLAGCPACEKMKKSSRQNLLIEI